MTRRLVVAVMLIGIALSGCGGGSNSTPTPTMGAAWGPNVVPNPAIPQDSDDAGITLTLEATNDDQPIEVPLESPSVVTILVRFGTEDVATSSIVITAMLPKGVTAKPATTTTLSTTFDDVVVDSQSRFIDQDYIFGDGLDLGPIEAGSGVRVTFQVEVTAESCASSTATIAVAATTEGRPLIDQTVDVPIHDCN